MKIHLRRTSLRGTVKRLLLPVICVIAIFPVFLIIGIANNYQSQHFGRSKYSEGTGQQLAGQYDEEPFGNHFGIAFSPPLISNTSNTEFFQSARKSLISNVHCNPARPNIITVRNVRWNLASDSRTGCEIAIYGAYYDHVIPMTSSVLRVFGVTNCEREEQVYCQLWYNNNSSISNEAGTPLTGQFTRQSLPPVVVVKSAMLDIGVGYNDTKRAYRERLYTCELPFIDAINRDVAIPIAVSLTHDRCGNARNFLRIIVPQPIKDTNEKGRLRYGLCLAVRRIDNIDVIARLIEWFEFTRLLGIGEFNVYLGDQTRRTKASDEAINIFRYYRDVIGSLRLRRTSSPIQNGRHPCFRCASLAEIPALNDCMYRNRYRYEYMFVFGFDEMVVPRMDFHYNQMFDKWRLRPRNRNNRNTDNDNRYSAPSSVEFSSAHFFDRDSSSQIGEDRELPYSFPNITYFKYLYRRISPNDDVNAPRSATNPRACVVVQQRYCIVFASAEDRKRRFVGRHDEVLIHNYERSREKKPRLRKSGQSYRWFDIRKREPFSSKHFSIERNVSSGPRDEFFKDVMVMRFREELTARIKKVREEFEHWRQHSRTKHRAIVMPLSPLWSCSNEANKDIRCGDE